MEISIRKSYKNRTCTKSTQVYWARFTAQAITHCQHTSVGCFLRVLFTSSANGTLIFPLGYLPSQPLQACCAKSQLQSRAQTGWTQSSFPGSSDDSELGTGSNLGTGSKTQDLSKSNWKRPFFLPLKGEQVCWSVWLWEGAPVCVLKMKWTMAKGEQKIRQKPHLWWPQVAESVLTWTFSLESSRIP